MRTPPKGRPTRSNPRSGRGIIPPTSRRRFHDFGHLPPKSGTERVRDRAERRRSNRRTWAKILASARREALAGKRDAMQAALTRALEAQP